MYGILHVCVCYVAKANHLPLCSSRLTGFQVPAPVTSTSNVFSLRLTSDFAVSAHGFKLNYEGQKVSVFVSVNALTHCLPLCSL